MASCNTLKRVEPNEIPQRYCVTITPLPQRVNAYLFRDAQEAVLTFFCVRLCPSVIAENRALSCQIRRQGASF